MWKGIALSGVSVAPSTEDLRSISALGGTHVRLEAMAGANMAGIHEYVTTKTSLTPVWLLGKGILPGRWAHTTYVKAVEQVMTVLHRAGPVAWVELLSEPNLGSGHPSSLLFYDYIAAVNAGAARVKTISRATGVIAGGIFAHATSGMEYFHLADEDYTTDVTAQGWHPYLNTASPLEQSDLSKRITEVRQTRKRPLVITEAGWDARVCGEELQAANVTALLERARMEGVLGTLVFSLHDAPEAVPALHYGIYNRKAAQAFKGARVL